MKKLSLFVVSSLLSIVITSIVATPAFAWHPQGKITKTVQDVTKSQTGSTGDGDNALSVAPGDTLVYTVTVSNTATPAANNDNNMAFTVMTDKLPGGITLNSDPSQTEITENIGTLTPGQNATKQYKVTVTDKTNGDVITNEACFTGNSAAKDAPQSGCDRIAIKVAAPSFSCDLLGITRNGRSVTINTLDTTATNGATLKDADINWGDDSAVLTTDTAQGQTHAYAADGTYRLAATAHFTVNGQDKTATSSSCTADVSLSTPQTLVNTGAGDALVPAVLASIVGYVLYLRNIRRRHSN